jgi:hypothetical protein
MPGTLKVEEIEALLAQAEQSMSRGQRAADNELGMLENGCSDRLRAHLDRYRSDPDYAAQVDCEDLELARSLGTPGKH